MWGNGFAVTPRRAWDLGQSGMETQMERKLWFCPLPMYMLDELNEKEHQNRGSGDYYPEYLKNSNN